MSKSFKTILIIIFLVIVAGLTVSWYPNYQNQRNKKQEITAEQKYAELSNLVTTTHDYAAVIKETDAYLNQHPDDEKMLYLNAVSKFDTQKFDEARVLFQKIIALNPDNQAAKNYLEILKPETGKVLVTEEGLKQLQLSKQEFEAILNVVLDEKLLVFVKAERHPDSGVAEYVSGLYKTTKSKQEILTYIKQTFKKLNPQISANGSTGLLLKFNSKESLNVAIYPNGQVNFDYVKEK